MKLKFPRKTIQGVLRWPLSENRRELAAQHNIETFRWMLNQNRHESDDILLSAAQNGNSEILRWIFDNTNSLDSGIWAAQFNFNTDYNEIKHNINDIIHYENPQECDICLFEKTDFIKCKTCKHELCDNCFCRLTIKRCPFCRGTQF